MANVKCRILCVDDHEDTSEMLKLLLSYEDYEVVVAFSMQEALEISRRESFDLYVLDKQLPDGTGLDLYAQLNKLTPGIPCIFYSGDAYEIQRREALEAGADAFVVKPDIDALINAVAELLADQDCGTQTKAMAK